METCANRNNNWLEQLETIELKKTKTLFNNANHNLPFKLNIFVDILNLLAIANIVFKILLIKIK